VAKATGREAPAQGSDPGCSTLNFRGLPWGISFKKKHKTQAIINVDSSLTRSTDLYWGIKRFSHTDHNWSEEHPENVIHKKSSLKMQKKNAFTYECQ